MVDKINKINTGSDFSKSRGPKIYRAGIHSKYKPAFDRHDSVDISPAFKYLIHVHWRLKNFKYDTDEKLFIDFIVSGIEFQLTVDLMNFNKLSSFNYRLYKEIVNGTKKCKIACDVTSKIEWINYDHNSELINFSALNIFFNRIFDQNIYNGLTNDDQYFIDDLVDGIIQGIKNEFVQLNNQVLIFFDRLTGKRIPNNLLTIEDNLEPILINKIKIIDV
ncbi:MAG TPA: hypothetical protein ENI57_12395 [Ignavibacteria bacterium]|nr:hypothetical protein [Ignavibacteria bacterium]